MVTPIKTNFYINPVYHMSPGNSKHNEVDKKFLNYERIQPGFSI